MKRAEQMAWAALAGLIAIAAMLLTGAIIYKFTAFWAGAMLAAGQAMAVGLAAWGLALARQASDLNQLPPVSGRREEDRSGMSGFRMSMGDDAPSTPSSPSLEPTEVKTLDIGFQRLMVAISGVILFIFAVLSGYLVYRVYSWGQANQDLPVPIVGTFKEPQWMDELGLIIGLSAAVMYGIFYWLSRPKRDPSGYGESISSTFTLGATAMGALAIGTGLGYLRVAYASEFAAAVIAFFLLLQGTELLVNALRNYSSIEELDQEAVDLQAMPLAPMLSSVWLNGLRMLFAQSVGLSSRERRERGVIARMMPRVLIATVLIAIGVSCIRVVEPGTVAVLERLGYAPVDETGRPRDEAMLQPGMHLTLPWPLDQLVVIPTQQLQLTNVGTELHTPKAWKGIDFQFWMFRDDSVADSDVEDLFVTGDNRNGEWASQILETYVQVRWRVSDPAAFYSTLSHSELFERETAETKALPIYEAIVKQCTSFAVTRTFAIHSLEQIMMSDRQEVEHHCRDILQDKLDSLGKSLGLPSSGISVEYLNIKDLHPPYWRPDRRGDPTQPRIGGVINFADSGVRIEPDAQGVSQTARGPASAFEFMASMGEFRERMMAMANAEATAKLNLANGFAESEIKRAQAYELQKVASAHGEADRLVKMTEKMDSKDRQYQLQLMKQQLLLATLKELWDPMTKIIVDPSVKDIDVYHATDRGLVPAPVARP